MREGDGASEMDGMTLQEYRELVERVMQDALVGGPNVARVFKNDGAGHANIVLNTMVDHAQGGLSLYSKRMSADVWEADRIIAFAKRAPGMGTVVRVLVDEPDACEAPDSALKTLEELIRAGRVVVRVADAGHPPRQHIAVADGRHVRIERDATNRTAVVAFGDQDIGATASELFDRAWDRAEPVSGCASTEA